MNNNWYRNAIIYGLAVQIFQDSDNDGVGDFKGLLSRLDYIISLGITCIWLAPFYDSPFKDNGYDVTNYFNIYHKLGNFEDFKTFIKKAHANGIKIIIDLVAHHTSNKHPWFEAARIDKESQYYNYYVWADQIPENSMQPVFPGPEKSVWTFDQQAGQYFHHVFYHYQPDLNSGNPKVREEILKIIDFWLSFGVDGFRLDAIPFILNEKDKANTGIKDPDTFLEKLQAFVASRKKEAILLGEANLPLEQLRLYVKDNKRLELLLNFLLNRTMFLAFARNNVKPIVAAFKKLQTVSKTPHWANYLRNLDELNLEYLSKEDMQKVFAHYAPESEMRIYNRGIRRRLAPMFNGKKERMAMSFALIFSLPGTPLFIYGDEIGMGDNLFLKGRTSVRLPMQWDDSKNGGFSHAETGRYVDRIVHHGHYSYKKINVANQEQDPDSLLHIIKKIIAARKKCPEIGLEECTFIEHKTEHILCITFCDKVLTITNLANKKTTISLKHFQAMKYEEILSDTKYQQVDFASLQLNPYGYRWFRRKAL